MFVLIQPKVTSDNARILRETNTYLIKPNRVSSPPRPLRIVSQNSVAQPPFVCERRARLTCGQLNRQGFAKKFVERAKTLHRSLTGNFHRMSLFIKPEDKGQLHTCSAAGSSQSRAFAPWPAFSPTTRCFTSHVCENAGWRPAEQLDATEQKARKAKVDVCHGPWLFLIQLGGRRYKRGQGPTIKRTPFQTGRFLLTSLPLATKSRPTVDTKDRSQRPFRPRPRSGPRPPPLDWPTE